ncbi:hypothetical protein C8Q73DRAFT_786506 [Cubamyces lactineus]|nr:hypothetical protein C8Q73DRAFT_786506 [Cubamyces lactineus]
MRSDLPPTPADNLNGVFSELRFLCASVSRPFASWHGPPKAKPSVRITSPPAVTDVHLVPGHRAPKKDKKDLDEEDVAFQQKKKAEEAALKAARDKAAKGGAPGGGIKKSGKK